jgi:hypothetical protein
MSHSWLHKGWQKVHSFVHSYVMYKGGTSSSVRKHFLEFNLAQQVVGVGMNDTQVRVSSKKRTAIVREDWHNMC